MYGYVFDTSALSRLLDPEHSCHRDVQAAISALDARCTKFVSVVVLAELGYGLRLAESVTGSGARGLGRKLMKAYDYAVLEVTKHTGTVYAELKANLASKYLAKAQRKDRPRWVEDWIDRATGKRLQVDENDLWICAQAKERDLTVVTADRGMKRIANADGDVRLHIV